MPHHSARAIHAVLSSTISLKLVAVLVLVPTTLVAAFWSLLGVPAFVDAVIHPNPVYPYRGWMLGPLLVAGWFGIVTLWRLYHHYVSGRPPGRSAVHWAGLATGCLVSIALLFVVRGQWLSAWPMVAAVYFALLLCTSEHAPVMR